ncbi:MAG: leucine-rich repeat domain-containing protein [Treponema sp.]|nr:leucine-rich repeat domain-containing protein [Treponema sp.]
MKKSWLLLACILCSTLALFAQNTSDFKTRIVNGQVTITGYSGSVPDIRIPDRINRMPVTSIGVGAFIGVWLTSVVIPNSVTAIGDYAFAETSLTSVVIPNSVTSIGIGAFYAAPLTSVKLPNSVTSIGIGAFALTRLTSVVIPNSVTAIGDLAFAETPLTSVVIPNSVTAIGEGAFYETPLTSVRLPNSVTSIGVGAFDDDVEIIRTDSGAKKSVSASSVLTVVNNTGYAFYYLYISSSDSDTWGRDVLGDQVLYDGQSFRYTLPYNGTWDIIAEDGDNDTYTRRLTVTSDTTLTLTLDDLD